MTIEQLLVATTKTLSAYKIESARLDAEVLLCHALKKPRHWLIAHSADTINTKQIEQFDKLVVRRSRREPIAYITHKKEFFGMEFFVNRSVLIPRPESEIIVEYTMAQASSEARVIDVGCGSGALAISIAAHRADITCLGVDISQSALNIAQKNQCNILPTNRLRWQKSNLLAQVPVSEKIDIVVANLPYLVAGKPYPTELSFEPTRALFSSGDGLNYYRDLTKQITAHPATQNLEFLLLECDPSQIGLLTTLFSPSHYSSEPISDFVLKVTPH